MKFIAGIHKDNHPADQPEGTYRDGRNIVLSKQRGAVSNEGGTLKTDDLPENMVPVGKVVLPDNRIVVFLAGDESSEIGVVKDGKYRTVLNSPELNFDPEHPITAAARVISSDFLLAPPTIQTGNEDGGLVAEEVTITTEQPAPSIQIVPSEAEVLTGQTQQFTAVGGVAPITYTVESGGGSISSGSGLYIAPGSPGSAVVRVTDSSTPALFDEAIVTIIEAPPELRISPKDPIIQVGQTQQFTATGGTAPYTFSKVSGVGSVNSSTGLFTAGNTPGLATIRVTDDVGDTDQSTVNVIAEPGQMEINLDDSPLVNEFVIITIT